MGVLFQKTSGIGLEIAYKSKNVILSTMGHSKDYPGLFNHMVNDELETINEFHSLFKNILDIILKLKNILIRLYITLGLEISLRL